MGHSDYFKTMLGQPTRKIPHWENFSCPDAESYLTGIDYYEHPRLCRLKMAELYPQLSLWIPDTDDPKPRPALGEPGGASVNADTHAVRWGDSETSTWEHGEAIFKTPEQVFSFRPLEKGDFRDWPFILEVRDYSSDEVVYENYRNRLPADCDSIKEEDNEMFMSFYNTLIMWPILTFGWQLFLECCLDERFDIVMEQFKEINRRVFRAFSRLPIRYVICHDDIVMTSGPVCSPKWMHKHVFPFYEEIWSMLNDAGIVPIFMSDGCMNAYADDVIACGAKGIYTEPYSDFKAIARKHGRNNIILAGEGDCRILARNNPEEIRHMVDSMVETSKMTSGYFMGIGNHIPWNTPPEAVKCYLDYAAEVAVREL